MSSSGKAPRGARLRTCVIALASITLFTTSSLCADMVYPMGDKGYAIMECEDLPHSSKWVQQTSISGYTGDGYLHWNGPCQSCECLGAPTDHNHTDLTGACQGPESDWLVFTVHISETGRYTLDVRNWHPNEDGANDAWMAAVDTSMRVCGDQNNPERYIYRVVDGVASAWSWCTSDLWNWNSYFITEPGFYTFYLAARSANFNADRIVVKRAIGNKVFPPASEDPTTTATEPVDRSSITATRIEVVPRRYVGESAAPRIWRGGLTVDHESTGGRWVVDFTGRAVSPTTGIAIMAGASGIAQALYIRR